MFLGWSGGCELDRVHYQLFCSALVCYRKLQGVSVWAPEEGGPRPGLPDTGGKAKHLALILTQLLVHAHTNTQIYTRTCTDTCRHIYLSTSWLPSVNRCFLPCSPTHTISHIRTHTRSAALAPLQVDPGARWRGSPTLWFSPGVFVNVGSCSTLLARSPQPRLSWLQFWYYWQDKKLTLSAHQPNLNPEFQGLSDMLLFYLTKTVLDNKRKLERLPAVSRTGPNMVEKGKSFHYGLNL